MILKAIDYWCYCVLDTIGSAWTSMAKTIRIYREAPAMYSRLEELMRMHMILAERDSSKKLVHDDATYRRTMRKTVQHEIEPVVQRIRSGK